ncbi:tail Collar domain-containing protein [Patiriisocius marinistellae]|uniref:Tail Collar domain-containing protein n=1 Tax=Patiriisocius marinistellae TaxID=2494560 RepID=A0A5J4FZN0_9FLAO|nr:tail fiber protein [Patiriisocius marinistellae]GEQ85495.1 tail Collar domain-containing protein [Patiriisocius marinistellae]
MPVNPFLGQIESFPYNFAPRGWARCDGQLLAISSNSALFSLIGTIYGGDGRTTFALPDLRSSVALHTGSGPGLSPRPIGQKLGAETHTLTEGQMPNHSHTLSVSSANGDVATPTAGNSVSKVVENQGRSANEVDRYNTATPNVNLNEATVGANGGNQPFNNVQPSLVLTWCIATQGIYPSRN